MIFNELNEIPFSPEKVIIINVGTRVASSLALMSVLKYNKIPIVLIDCPINHDKNDDFNYFSKLNRFYSFDLVSLPLNEHGKTLDFVFCNLKTEYILLVDSDIEIIDDKIIDFVREHIRKEKTFGAGFTHGPCLVKSGDWIKNIDGRYEERMWIPFSMLNVELVKLAIESGCSFQTKTIYNIIPNKQKVSAYLFHKCRIKLISFISSFLGQNFGGKMPLFIAYDTGADIYQFLKNNKYYHFFGYDANSSIQNNYVIHYGGVTRKLLDVNDDNGTKQEKFIENEIKEKLEKKYNFIYE